jgi:hypothetical protein
MKSVLRMISGLSICISILIGVDASALSCRVPLEFIIKCNSGTCSEGFFAIHRLSGSRCSTRLDVHGNEKLYAFDGQLGVLHTDNEPLNGYYSIEVKDSPIIGHDDLKYMRCITIDESGVVSIKCRDHGKLTKLKYSADTNFEAVIADYVTKTLWENRLTELLRWIFPMFVLGVLGVAFYQRKKKYAGKINLLLFVVSLVGLFEIFYGRPSWILAGLVGALYSLSWWVLRIFNRIRSRKAP